MPDLPVPLNSGESVWMDTEAIYPRNSLLGIGYNPVLGHLWLTNQRLVFKGTILGQTFAFPISRVTHAAPTQRQIKTSGAKPEGFAAFMNTSTLMVVEFDNGGREYFAVKDLAGWSEVILTARAKAPPLDYTSTPSRRSGVETGLGQAALWFGGAVALLCVGFACCVGLITLMPTILSSLNGGGR